MTLPTTTESTPHSATWKISITCLNRHTKEAYGLSWISPLTIPPANISGSKGRSRLPRAGTNISGTSTSGATPSSTKTETGDRRAIGRASSRAACGNGYLRYRSTTYTCLAGRSRMSTGEIPISGMSYGKCSGFGWTRGLTAFDWTQSTACPRFATRTCVPSVPASQLFPDGRMPRFLHPTSSSRKPTRCSPTG
jgi:hypothetical protein